MNYKSKKIPQTIWQILCSLSSYSVLALIKNTYSATKGILFNVGYSLIIILLESLWKGSIEKSRESKWNLNSDFCTFPWARPLCEQGNVWFGCRRGWLKGGVSRTQGEISTFSTQLSLFNNSALWQINIVNINCNVIFSIFLLGTFFSITCLSGFCNHWFRKYGLILITKCIL